MFRLTNQYNAKVPRPTFLPAPSIKIQSTPSLTFPSNTASISPPQIHTFSPKLINYKKLKILLKSTFSTVL